MTPRACAFLLVALAAASCHREERPLTANQETGGQAPPIKTSDLQPGPGPATVEVRGRYEGNAFAISEGERLFSWYNCVGCHSHGGGGMGPPLMDAFWIYGKEPQNVYASILEGRPNGMPSFRGKIADDDVWKLVAYVRSLGGLQPESAVAPRSDSMSYRSRHQSKP
jgi:cytochrome c oxidase cbb3-type subunit 3